MINSCHHCYFLFYGHKCHDHHNCYSACFLINKKKGRKRNGLVSSQSTVLENLKFLVIKTKNSTSCLLLCIRG